MGQVDFAFAGLQLTTDERLLTPREWTAAQSRWAAELLPTLPSGVPSISASIGTNWSRSPCSVTGARQQARPMGCPGQIRTLR